MRIHTVIIAGLVCYSVARAGTLGNGTAVSGSWTEGLFQNLTVATFTDSDPNEPLFNLSTTINWGDSVTSAGTITSFGGGLYGIGGGHTYFDEGTYNLTVDAYSSSGSQLTISGSATVADAPLSGTGFSVSGTEGAGFTGTLGSFSDANPNAAVSDFFVTINWGDGTVSPGTITFVAGQFQVSGSHTYADEGTYQVTTTANDIGGSAATFSSIATIAEAPLSGSPTTLPAFVPGAVFSGNVGTFFDLNPDSTASEFTALINWGDGSIMPGTVLELSPGTFAVSGQHIYSELGEYPVSIDVSDVGGSTTQIVDEAFVTPEPGTMAAMAVAFAILFLRRRHRASRIF